MTAPLMESGTYATRPDESRWVRVAMHGDGWSGRGHQLTCPRCNWSTARRYLKDAEAAHPQHACVAVKVCADVRDHGGHSYPCGRDPDCTATAGECCDHCYWTDTRSAPCEHDWHPLDVEPGVAPHDQCSECRKVRCGRVEWYPASVLNELAPCPGCNVGPNPHGFGELCLATGMTVEEMDAALADIFETERAAQP